MSPKKILHGEPFSVPFAASPEPDFAKILRFVSAATYTFRELKKAFLRRYALFSTHKPRYRNQRNSESWGPFWNFPSKFA